MKLSAWLTDQNLRSAEFARRVGKPQATISRYVTGQRIPEPEEMALIFRETGGAVTPNDFYAIEPTPTEQEHDLEGAA